MPGDSNKGLKFLPLHKNQKEYLKWYDARKNRGVIYGA